MLSAGLSYPLCKMGIGVSAHGSEGGGEAGVLLSRRSWALQVLFPPLLPSARLSGDAGLPGEREPHLGDLGFMCFSLRVSEGPHTQIPKRWPRDGVPGPPCPPAEHVPAGPGGAGGNRYECVLPPWCPCVLSRPVPFSQGPLSSTLFVSDEDTVPMKVTLSGSGWTRV